MTLQKIDTYHMTHLTQLDRHHQLDRWPTGGEMESSVRGGAQRGALLSFNFDRVSLVKELRREGIIY